MFLYRADPTRVFNEFPHLSQCADIVTQRNDPRIMENSIRFRQFTAARKEEFYSKGYQQRYFFPHKVLFLPKCGPDAVKIATRMTSFSELNNIYEIILYADSPVIDEFPRELFFDNDLVWHQQQFGIPGQIATANLLVAGSSVYTMVHISDLVQRISRNREHKTRIENRFKGWHHLLLNAILNFAQERNLKTVYSCNSELALKNTDPKRTVQQELFERVYDRNLHELFHVEAHGSWWSVDVAANRDKIISAEIQEEELLNQKTICLCHDVEEGFGHTEADPAFATFAHRESPANLDRMLEKEKKLNVKATYNVLGNFFNRVREKIERDGHCLAFHSYDHGFDETKPVQLQLCRSIDYRIKGYRPPQSKITQGLSDEHLTFHNFEWLASSIRSLGGLQKPKMVNRLVKLPVQFDDFAMYKEGTSYQDWERGAIERISSEDISIFCLHDCYAHFWLPHYESFLEKISRLGKLTTLNEIAAAITLSNSE